jgi:FkbM family methyltransferase
MNIVVKHYLRKLKYSPLLRSQDVARRIRLVKNFRIDHLLDVGANAGQYGSVMRALGYRGKLISFEPLSDAYRSLRTLADRDTNWETHNMALGDIEQEMTINVSKNLLSSSLLDMLPRHLETAPESEYCKSEPVKVRTLNQIYSSLVPDDATTLLKIDTQGYERQVLQGSDAVLDKITGVQIEMSLVPLYDHGALFHELMTLLGDNGFTMMSIEAGFQDPNTGQLLQMDGVFFRI